jgi:hypothetical protein
MEVESKEEEDQSNGRVPSFLKLIIFEKTPPRKISNF